MNIAVSMMSDPGYILLDEPFAGVDRETTEDILRYLAQEKASGKGIVISAHDREMIRELVDRILLLSDGKQTFLGSTEQFFAMEGV